jgi:glutamate/tyrosine decarboxylase-like PLP-dependent enzyme
MRGHDALFPRFKDLEIADIELSRTLSAYRRRYSVRNATAQTPSEDWCAELERKDFREPEDLQSLMDWTMAALDAGAVQVTHPGYLGLFNPAPSFASECADRIASAFNPQICVYSHAPAAVEIERHVISEIAQRIGLPPGSSGHFTSGGAEANNTALLCALQAKCPDYADQGLGAFSGRPTLYISADSHLAWLKMAHACGVGRNAVRLIDTDGQGRMCAQALRKAIGDDLKTGCVPTLVAATAGTTNAGMIDPLAQCRDISEEFGMWFHVDAAWGGAVIASDRYRHVLPGIEHAHSITIDAHKWFATTMGAGMFFTARPEICAQAFRVSASYMPESDASKDYYMNSSQWSRRFVGLRMFLALGAAGWSGYAEHIERSIQLTDRFTETLKKAGWRHANNSPLAVSCMTPPEGHQAVQAYVDAVLNDGRFWVSKAMFEGRPVLRACVTNARTDETLIDQLTGFLASGFD